MSWNQYFLALEALASCAIEGNPVAIELLELQKKDPEAFVIELYKCGWLTDESKEAKSDTKRKRGKKHVRKT